MKSVQVRCPSYMVMLAAALAACTSSAWAVTVSGDTQAVAVDAQNSTLSEILEALCKKFNFHYNSLVSLGHIVTGTYQGPFPDVLQRVLEGYDFVMRSGPHGVEVTVFGGRSTITSNKNLGAPTVSSAQASGVEPQAGIATNAAVLDGSSPAFKIGAAEGPVVQRPQTSDASLMPPRGKPVLQAPQPGAPNPAAVPSLGAATIAPPTPQPSTSVPEANRTASD